MPVAEPPSPNALPRAAGADLPERGRALPALDLEPPGTYVYTAELALAGHAITQFGLSLRDAQNRAAFLSDEAAYMQSHGLSVAEMALVQARDWKALLAAGGHLQALLKIAATAGQNLWDVGAAQTGIPVDELIATCPRDVSALPGDS